MTYYALLLITCALHATGTNDLIQNNDDVDELEQILAQSLHISNRHEQNNQQQTPTQPFYKEHHFFTPNIYNKLLHIISNEQKGMDIAMYHFSDQSIAHTIAKQQVSTRIMCDTSYRNNPPAALQKLARQGALVSYVQGRFSKYRAEYESMHSKFVIFHKNKNGKKILWLGSFNFTEAARNSIECAVIITNPDTISAFENEFKNMMNNSFPIPHNQASNKSQAHISTRPVFNPQIMQPVKHNAYFTPHIYDNLVNHLIHNEQQKIDLAMFEFTDLGIAQKMIQNNRTIHILCDEKFKNPSRFTAALRTIVKQQNNLAKYLPHNLMHLKCAVFYKNKDNKPLLWVGSFNCTGAAQNNNSECIAIIKDKNTINAFKEKFDTYMNRGKKIQLNEIPRNNHQKAKFFTHKINHTTKYNEQHI
jgi:phosphatidylserine/phosphatidylglycerophosphate/cardiolipin synthase-like enzyme